MDEPENTAATSHSQEVQELTKLIRKLRWFGMDDEAVRLQTALDSLRIDGAKVPAGTPGAH